MVKKSLLIALFLLGFYSFLIHLSSPWRNPAQTQWHQNNVQAERFLFNPSKEHIIVGSSLAARLVQDSLPTAIHNLAFAGQSIYDGFQIIKQSAHRPKTVFVEINTIFTQPKPEFVDELFSPLTYSLKSYLPAFRAEYMPIANLVPYLIQTKNALFSQGEEPRPVRVSNPQPTQTGKSVINPIFQKVLDQKRDSYKRVPSTEEIDTYLSLLQTYVQDLSAEGTEIVFFELPIHPSLCNSYRAERIRQEMFKVFPPDSYTYSLASTCEGYETTDGTHLTSESALYYTLFFRKTLLSQYL